ncbi:MAG: GNAT family N-acetyltransferase [Myxococcales bacterium]|nr:GNAT family N-acetyltransferase [Myxococcales bacterium]
MKVRRFEPHEWTPYRELRLRALRDAPDAFGSTFDREAAASDPDWAARLAAGGDARWNHPLVVEIDGQPAGLAWGRIEPEHPERADLYPMWVAPERRGLGAATRLLAEVIAWATEAGARTLCLNATVGDTPANRLYASAGFEPVGPTEPLRPGSAVLAQAMRLELR